MKYLYLILAMLLTSCGPAYYLKRAERNIKKAEMLGAKITPDTVYVTRNIIVPEYQTDTVFERVEFTDTFRLETTKVLTKVKVNYQDRTVYVKSICKADTIIKRVPVTVTKTIEAKAGIPWWVWAVFGFSAVIITVLLFRR
jgi:hypothetical protein